MKPTKKELVNTTMKLDTQPSQTDHSSSKNRTTNDSFSFPSTPNQEDSDFEFGSLTPDSPSCTTSPADQLFFNGRLQPHSFPLNHVTTTSRTTSIGSKDSFLSSRSNSTNSSCSSARTSSSDTSERKLVHNRVKLSSRSVARPVQQSYGCSQRWQYIMPVPVGLNRDASKRRKQKRAKREEKKRRMKKRVSLQFVRRIFRWFFIACRQCHAMEPSKVRNKEIKTQ